MVKISGVLHYGVPHNHIVVLARKTLDIILIIIISWHPCLSFRVFTSSPSFSCQTYFSQGLCFLQKTEVRGFLHLVHVVNYMSFYLFVFFLLQVCFSARFPFHLSFSFSLSLEQCSQPDARILVYLPAFLSFYYLSLSIMLQHKSLLNSRPFFFSAYISFVTLASSFVQLVSQ